MRRYNQRLYRVARGIVRDHAEAEDVMQQAYLNAYTHLHQYEQRGSFAGWLTRIAVHEAFAGHRRRAAAAVTEPIVRRRRLATASPPRTPTPRQAALSSELRRDLEAIDRRAGRRLPSGVRAARGRGAHHRRDRRGAGPQRGRGQDPPPPRPRDAARGARPRRTAARAICSGSGSSGATGWWRPSWPFSAARAVPRRAESGGRDQDTEATAPSGAKRSPSSRAAA